MVGSILFLLQPSALFGQRNVMLEMPALSMSIMALYFLYVGTEEGKTWGELLFPVFMAVSFLTKQNAVFLLPVCLLWIIAKRKWYILKSGRFILGALVGTIVLMPWIIISMTVGRSYVAAQTFQIHHIWDNMVYYVEHGSEIISYPIILLCVTSIILVKRLWHYDSYQFALLWTCAVVLTLLLLQHQEQRFAMFVVPALVILSLQLVSFCRERFGRFFQRRGVYHAFVVILVGCHLWPTHVWGSRDIRGFDDVADFVVADQDCVSVLYDGYFNSNFVFHMRARDIDRRVFVFRASKLVFSSSGWLFGNGYVEMIKDKKGFLDILDRYSIKYIVQEEKDSVKTVANKKLRAWIKESEFRLVHPFPTDCRGMAGFGSLLVYEYLDYERKPIQQVDLEMPVQGRRISVKLEKQE